MRYASIRDFDISNGEGIGASLFVQGCEFHCKGCFNSETWDFKGGEEWTEDKEKYFMELVDKPYISRVSILGGEPLHPVNREAVLNLCKKIKTAYPNKAIWVYTGYTIEELKSENVDLSSINTLVDGRYVHELKDYKLKFRGSSNQRIFTLNQQHE